MVSHHLPAQTWPENLFPLQPVGRMVLNRNIDNFHAENEMLAFCPGITVPGERGAWQPCLHVVAHRKVDHDARHLLYTLSCCAWWLEYGGTFPD